MKLKFEEQYSHSKLWSMCNIWELDLFYVFVNSLVSILLSVSSRFFVTLDCWSLQWGKTDWIVCANDSIQQERLFVSLGVGRIYF